MLKNLYINTLSAINSSLKILSDTLNFIQPAPKPVPIKIRPNEQQRPRRAYLKNRR